LPLFSAIELITLALMTTLIFTTSAHAQVPAASTAITSPQQQFLSRYCTDCHEPGNAENDVILSDDSINWTKPESREQWELVQSLIDRQIMPPTDSEQPSEKERAGILSWLDTQLVEHSPIGGTPLRRLSSREYRNTIAAIFDLPKFQLPSNFPPDSSVHGFDNQGENLMIAGSHLEAIADTATAIADSFFLPPPPAPEQREVIALPKDLTISYSSACLIDGTMRLASSGPNLRRNATWPSRFLAPATGEYLLEITASVSPNASVPAELEVSAMTNAKSNSRVIHRLNLDNTKPRTMTVEARLEKGETVTLRFANGALDYENKPAYKKLLIELFDEQPRLAAAWHAVGDPARGGSGWARVVEKLNDPNLDATPFINEKSKRDAVATTMTKNSVKSGETLVYRFFEQGPYLAIHGLKIVGPTEVYPSKDEVLRLKRRKEFTSGLSEKSPRAEIESFLQQFLGKTFRRSAHENEITAYANLIQAEHLRTGSLDQGLHLAVRSALLSPAFLYRNIGDGKLTDNELASRLSYFLKSMPPDERLQKIANDAKLGNTKTLLSQAKRLCSSQALAADFTSQWLGLDTLNHLMPDVRLIQNFKPTHKASMKLEVQRTFQHVLDNNLPVHDLVTPDFIFTDERLGWDFYGLQQYKPAKKRESKKIPKGMQQVTIERDARRGGLLTMPAVLMATANGVDTQPVLRGVWVLENILGNRPPEPPNAVPALTPDTRGTSSPRERLAAHMASESCAACHKAIDPLGFVLENFDPVGRWRDHYPLYVEEKGKSRRVDGAKIDASGMLPDGQTLNDIQDLKRWLKDNPEPFVCCISEKLLSYATGRQMNYRERKIIKEIVASQATNEYRFRDLLLALVQSEIFRTK
jgi:mono/diheme cytochrome c family protein